jgi:uncharacterized protein
MNAWMVLIVIVGTLVVLDALLHVLAARLVLPFVQYKVPFRVEPAAIDPGAECISFPTTDGLTLRGSLYRTLQGASRGLIVFCPEYNGKHWSAMAYAGALRHAGLDVLAFDFRNQGDSDFLPGYEPLHWLTEYEVADVLAAIRYAKSCPDLVGLPLGLFGVSRGGGAALAAACRCRSVKAIACEGAYSIESLLLHYALRWGSLYIPERVMRMIPLWHMRMTLALARWTSQWSRKVEYILLERELTRLRDRPVLMVAGARDTYVVPEVTDRLCSRIGPSCRPLWVVAKAQHNQARKHAAAEYDRRLLELFANLR